MYFAFFLVVGAAAYGLIQTTSAPTVSMEGEAHAAGENLTFGDRTYEVASVGASGAELVWTNESGVVTTSIDNGTAVPPTDVVWADQTARREATFADGDAVAFNDSRYRVTVNATAGAIALTNVNDTADNVTVEAGGTFQFRGFEATVTEVADGEATVVWGNPYLLLVAAENVTDPTEATFVEQRNLTQLAVNDPALYDDLVRQNGRLWVTYRANDTNVPVDRYFAPVERHTVAEGDRLVYQGNETTVDDVTNESVVLARSGETTVTVDLAEGENVTIQGTRYFATFPSNSSVQLFQTDERYDEYDAQLDRIDDYHERTTGLWGVAELSAIAAVILLGAALLPAKG